MTIKTKSVSTPSIQPNVSQRLKRVLEMHFDPVGGSKYWLERAKDLSFDPRRDVSGPDDLQQFAPMTQDALLNRPLQDFIPTCLHDQLTGFVMGQTGGATGPGAWTAYRDDEFHEAFVTPFLTASQQVGFPTQERWLYVGPSGPHIIGKVIRHLARAVGSHDPFSIDFDPRWIRRLPADSVGFNRYVRHMLDQALVVIDQQQIGVLFATPAFLEPLAREMTAAQRKDIRGVHYGGMALSAEQLKRFQGDLFPNAIHLSGYGNTLFGCCLELDVAPSRQSLNYFPHGDRLLLDVVNSDGTSQFCGQRGRVCFTRLDESFLLIRMLERDHAVSVLPETAVDGFGLPGVMDPMPIHREAATTAATLY